MGEQWEREERHQVVITGPPVADAVELMAELTQALSDYWVVAGVQPHTEVPRGAVTVSAAGGVLSVRVEYVQTDGREPEPGDLPVEGERDDDLT